MSANERDRLLFLLDRFADRTVVVLGDFVADEFVTGEIARVSREAPVLILRHRTSELRPGGAANAANNLVELGARVLPVSAVGADAAGRALLEHFRRRRVDTAGVLRVPGWTTPTKTRFLAGWAHAAAQQVLRVDREPTMPLPERARQQLVRLARERLERAEAVLLSDYGLGVLTPELVGRLRPRRWPCPVTLDSRHRLLAYAGLGLTAATPNEPELEAQYGTTIGSDPERLRHLGERARRRLGCAALVVTRGRDGMALFERGRPLRLLPIYGSDHATDVTGAGDTVIAVFTLALAAGASFYEAARLANYAGGLVVMKRGTATVSREELEQAVRTAEPA
jgi:rfaE bifunctional protein kinase chain/domain